MMSIIIFIVKYFDDDQHQCILLISLLAHLERSWT